MPERRKEGLFQLLRDAVLSGILLFSIGIFWQTATFYTKVNLFMEAQNELHKKIEAAQAQTDCDIENLKQWKVSVTRKPFADYVTR